ncbi:phage protein [Leptospira sp. WS58.C1]|uniref:phage structural protein n=1 Tax=Leptospira cinconiae TaxID=3235173 RepID=UPI00349E8110
MADKFLGTYDPNQVTLSVSGRLVSGFFDGTFISVKRAENEIYKTHVGARGEVSRTKNNNTSGQITFTLKGTSPDNAFLDLVKNLPNTFPVMVKNNSDGKFVAVASQAWVTTDPDKEFGVEESGVEWVLTCADLNKAHLG